MQVYERELEEVMQINLLCLFCLGIAWSVQGSFTSWEKVKSYRKFVNNGMFKSYLQKPMCNLVVWC